MAVTIKAITPGTPAAKTKIKVGDSLISINRRPIRDVLDYRFFIPDTRLSLVVSSQGRLKTVKIKKEEFAEIGLEFDTYLMDEQRSCKNKCIFCFIDQLPEGMRQSLYFKDDDSRLSFLFGNYITLTNLTQEDISRIIEMHISPINVSVHTTNPDLRCRMMNNRFAGEALEALEQFAGAGLSLNCQLVLVPGYNDGDELDRSLRDLAQLGEAVKSVAAVPVGLTKYRDNLPDIRMFTKEESARVIDQITKAGDRMKETAGSRVFYPSDEWYIQAELPIPDGDFYEDYPQLENGVGMIASFREQFRDALREETRIPAGKRFVLATGQAAAPFMEELMEEARQKWENLRVEVRAIRNDFFGETITVSGLITGGDLIKQLTGVPMDILLLPSNMLRQEEDVFLDDVPLSRVADTLGAEVRISAENDGASLLEALMKTETE